MIKAKVLQEDYRRHLNRRNSEYSKAVSISDGDKYLNEALDFIFENLVVKYEINSIARQYLSDFKVSNVKLKLETIGEDKTKAIIPNEYYKIVRNWVKVCKETCDKEKTFGVHIAQSGDINKSLLDPFYKPSWEWEFIIGNEFEKSIMLYHDCDFSPKEVWVDYLRRPKHIATPSLTSSGSYVDANGETISQDIDFESDNSFLWRRVSRLASINTLLDMDDINDYQAQLNQIMALDKIYLN